MIWQKMTIRTRLIVAYMSIILVGFAIIAVIAGSQIASASRADFQEQFSYSSRLISQGLRTIVEEESNIENIPSEDLVAAIESYEVDSNINIEIVNFNDPAIQETFDQFDPPINDISRNRAIVRRVDANGNEYLYTAITIFESNGRGGRRADQPPTDETTVSSDAPPTSPIFLIFSIPYKNLQTVIIQRWATLISLFLLVTLLTILASLWVAQSIIRPLYTLRDTAVLVAQGNFSHKIKNITKDEIGEVSQAFNEMATQVEDMLEEQRAFASNASHELRTPLTAIRLRSETLRYEEVDSETQARYIEEIDDEAIRMSNLIEDLTLLSRLDANRTKLGNSQINISKFAEGFIKQLDHIAHKKHITITLKRHDTLQPVVVSINHLTIIFRNIIDNAIKYTPENGAITWELSSDDKYVTSTIVDTGHGIDPKNIERIFLRFYREDASRSRSIQGTGLGLTLVKSIVEAYRGHINIYSDGVNTGTSVIIKFPI